MNEKESLLIRGFINERDMQETVRSLLFKNFLRSRPNADVHILAAQTLAVQFLDDAWSEMLKHKSEGKKSVQVTNIAL
jgi:hypothetical protein